MQKYKIRRLAKLKHQCIEKNNLQQFYKDYDKKDSDADKQLNEYAECLAKLPALWHMGIETILQLAILCLYDLVILIGMSRPSTACILG